MKRLLPVLVAVAGCASLRVPPGPPPPHPTVCGTCIPPCPNQEYVCEPGGPGGEPSPARVTVSKDRLELREKVYFETGKTTVRPISYPLLDEAATVMAKHPELKRVVVEGHTDATGGAAVNERLSRGRAQAVRAYLVNRGVAPGRLVAAGFGERRPVASNATVQGRERNRRVEFAIAGR